MYGEIESANNVAFEKASPAIILKYESKELSVIAATSYKLTDYGEVFL